MDSFTIVIDSNCDLPSEYIEEHGIEVLPMPFELDGKAHNLGYWQEISAKEFYDALRNGSIVRTSQITPAMFVTAFTEYARQGREVLLLGLSSGLSATYHNTVTALEEVRESYPDCNIYSVDSLSASSGIGMLAMLAVRKRAEGLSARETAEWLEKKKHTCFAFFTVDDLMYLHRGGRLSKLSAVTGSVLGVKPVLNVAPDGTLQLKDKVRGRKAALKHMASQIVRTVNPGAKLDTVLVNHTDCLEDAQAFAELIKATVSVREVIILMMGPIIGAHLGPGTVTLLFEANMTREEYEKKYYK